MPVLTSIIAGELKPLRKGGVTFYPAKALARVVDWALQNELMVERVEGLFYRPDTFEGQLSIGYIGDRDGRSEAAFRTVCMELAQGLEAEAASKGMSGYFEIVVSGEWRLRLRAVTANFCCRRWRHWRLSTP